MAYQVTSGTVKTVRRYVLRRRQGGLTGEEPVHHQGGDFSWLAYTPTAARTQLPERMSDYWANLATSGRPERAEPSGLARTRCRRGGTIYDLAAPLYGYDPRGDDFKSLRTELRRLFGIEAT